MMKHLISFILIGLSFHFSFAQKCEPGLSLVHPAAVEVKEGHDQKTSLFDVAVEMDRYCPGETITLKVLVLSETAIVGEHIQIAEVNELVIPAGQISAGLSIGIIGDNDWNEDRSFSVRIINPSHGFVQIAQSQILIKNDDPKIYMKFPDNVNEPLKGIKSIPLKLELSIPADRVITGEIEIKGLSATLGEDFISSQTIGFEFLPGDTHFDFLPHTLSVSSDDLKEKSENLSFYMNLSKGATPSPSQVYLTIKDPELSYKISIHSIIKGMSDNQVAMISTYKHEAELFEVANLMSGLYQSETLAPMYKHEILNAPFKPTVKPGLLRVSAQIQSENLDLFRLEFIESPKEEYPFNADPLFMFMSSFGKLHEDEFITLKDPQTSDYPAFDLKQFKKVKAQKWQAEYNRNLTEDGSEVLKENTTVIIEQVEKTNVE